MIAVRNNDERTIVIIVIRVIIASIAIVKRVLIRVMIETRY